MYLSYNTYTELEAYTYIKQHQEVRRRLIKFKFFKYTPDKTVSKSFCHIANPLGGCNYEVYLEKIEKKELNQHPLI